ncbi:hypothetical protein J3R83DRAFT_8419 [Lanmaoa asiatica]|nr:hypothetical protein J3R83DRAFT_8419 [Lanmaoa asiatica]
MQTQVLVRPPPLLAKALPTALPRVLHYLLLTDLFHLLDPSHFPILDKQPPAAAQSGPSYSHTLHILDDDVPRSGLRDHTSLTSPQQYSISFPIPAILAPSLPQIPVRVSARKLNPPLTSPLLYHHQSFVLLHYFPRLIVHHIIMNQFAPSATAYIPDMDRYPIANLADRYLRGSDKYSHNQHPLLDQRRMSEPAMCGTAASGYPNNAADLFSARYHQLQHSYVSPRSYGAHPSSPLHRSPDAQPISGSSWKEHHRLPLHSYDSVELEEPLSPLNPTFSGGESSPMGMSTAMFGSLHEDYSPSPPGTGTSTSSNAPTTHQQAHTTGGTSSPSNSKQYSFVSLPGNAVKKRPRRRYDEIERLYQCSWPNCTKAYGTLNHLNAHITMQKHGPKRSPNEFKELRKQWRKAKKEEAET